MSSVSTFLNNETVLPDNPQSPEVMQPQSSGLQFDPDDKAARVLMVELGLTAQISASILNDISHEVKYSENEGEAIDEDGSARYERRETLVETLASVLYHTYVAHTALSATVDLDRWNNAIDGIIWGVLIDGTANWFTGNGEEELERPTLDPSEQVSDEILNGSTFPAPPLPTQRPYHDEFSKLNYYHHQHHPLTPIESHATQTPMHDGQLSHSPDFTPGLDNMEMGLDTPLFEAPTLLTSSKLRPRYIRPPVHQPPAPLPAPKSKQSKPSKSKPSPQALKKQKGKGRSNTVRKAVSRSVDKFSRSCPLEPVIIFDQYMQVIERVCIHITIHIFHHQQNCLVWLGFVPNITQFLFFAKKQSKLRFKGVDVVKLQVLNRSDLEEWLDIEERYGGSSSRAKARKLLDDTETPRSFQEILVENLIRRPGKLHDGYVSMVVKTSG